MKNKTIKDWLLETFSESLETILDIADKGCAGGFSGLIYYEETVAFHDKYEEEIWDLLDTESERFDYKTILQFISSFNGARDVGSMDQFKNLLCWYAVEQVANELAQQIEADGKGGFFFHQESSQENLVN